MDSAKVLREFCVDSAKILLRFCCDSGERLLGLGSTKILLGIEILLGFPWIQLWFRPDSCKIPKGSAGIEVLPCRRGVLYGPHSSPILVKFESWVQSGSCPGTCGKADLETHRTANLKMFIASLPLVIGGEQVGCERLAQTSWRLLCVLQCGRGPARPLSSIKKDAQGVFRESFLNWSFEFLSARLPYV